MSKFSSGLLAIIIAIIVMSIIDSLFPVPGNRLNPFSRIVGVTVIPIVYKKLRENSEDN